MFGEGFFQNTAFIFTRWKNSKKAVWNRKKVNDTEEMKAQQINKFLKEEELFETANFTLPCFFIDNSLNNKDEYEDADDEEKSAYNEVRLSVKNWVNTLQAFECKNFIEVEKEN